MKIKNVKNEISFKRKLSSRELKDYQSTIKEGKRITGQTGKSIFIMPTSNLPQGDNFNSGVGTLTSEYAQKYIDYMKSYLDFNVIEDLPPGQIKPFDGFYCSYISSSLALGDQQINPELLTKKTFGELLSQEDLEEIASGNTEKNADYLVNFFNVTSADGKQNTVLKKAYSKFLEIDENSPLKKKYDNYCKDNAFWLNFKRTDEIDEGFFKFKQFLADEHLKIGKETLNKKGIKLCGDCPLRFSQDEIMAFPKAFKKNSTMGIHSWNIPSLNFDEILDTTSDAHKLFKTKIQLFAKRYDLIRFDVGWEYIAPLINTEENGKIISQKKDFGSKLLEQIEAWVKEIKGQDFDLKNLLWEVEAGPEDFEAFKNGHIIKPLKDRVKIYSSTHMHKKPYDSWGYNQAYLDRGWSKESFILGIGNHDPQPLAQIAKNMPDEYLTPQGIVRNFHKHDAIEALSDILHLDKASLEDPRKFVDAKWADTMSCYNTQMFYMDVFGREERFNKQDFNLITTPFENYAYKVPKDYQNAYHLGLQEGLAFNPARALEINFKARGLDKKNPELYNKIKKYAEILESKEIKKTKNKYAKAIIIAASAIAISAFALTKIKKHKKTAINVELKTIMPTFSFSEFQKNVSKLNTNI